MDMKFKKTFGLLLALTLTAGALSAADIPLSAEAEGAPVVFSRENAELLLPDSYEEYLPLENPAYVAMNEEHIAIADNYSIYVYDRAREEYSVYHHILENVSGGNREVFISKIQFTDDGRLYFRDNESHLFRYDFETDSSVIVDNIACLTFLIHGDYMYMANESSTTGIVNFTYVPIDDMRLTSVETLSQLAAFNPRMAFENNTLYCIINNNTVNAYDASTHTFLKRELLDRSTEQIANLQFVCAFGDEFFYTVNGDANPRNGLYRTDHAGNAVRIAEGEKYSSITSYGGKLYSVQGSSIREMEIKGNAVELTGYEISIASSSPHRLANAGEVARTKELVVYADSDNRRVSVYNRLDGTYTTIPCLDENGENLFTPEHIAVDKEENRTEPNGDNVTSNKIAVSNGNRIYVYTFERHSLKGKKNGVAKTDAYNSLQNVKGMSFVYGECYYITEFDGYGSLGNATVTELHFNGVNTPEAITSDIYGTIYVAFGNAVYTFTEKDFKGDHASGTRLLSLSADSDKVYTSLSVDYEGDIWHTTADGKLYCNNEEVASIDGKDFVYLKEEHAYPVSFALSFEDDEIYFNFGNFVVKTKPFALESLVSLNKIASGEAKERTFALAERDNLFVKVPSGSVGFEIDLDALKSGDGEYFPYERYFRSEGLKEGGEARRGVLLYEPANDDGYYVVALYNGERHTFTANLFKKSKNAIAPDENCFEESDGVMFVTSDVSLCSAPCLFPAPEGERLSTLSDTLLKRGARLQVIGYATGEDRAYAFVEVLDGTREAVRGFIPRSYLSSNDPLGIPEKNYKLGYLKGGTDAVLKSESGAQLTILENTQARLYENGDGTYTAVVEKDGIVYTGTVTDEQISYGETDALRISLIVILSVLALVIVTGYVFLMFPRRKKK